MIPTSWIAPALGLAALIGSHWFAYSSGVDAESNRREAAINGAAVAGMTAARAAEAVQATTIQTEVKRTNETIAALPDNRDELERLRNDNAALVRELSDSAAAAKRGEAATKAGMVYAELLERATARIAGLERTTARAVELAERYDVAHARGELCVVTYGSLASSR